MEQVFNMQITKRWLLGLAVLCFASLPAFGANVNDYVPRIRALQDKVEFAYAQTGGMTKQSMFAVVAAIDDAMVLMREVTMAPIGDGLSEEDKGRLYEEIIWGERGNKSRGSLATLFWSSMIHHGGYDPKETYDGRTSVPEAFGRTFLEVFNDLRSFVTVRKDHDGRMVWTPTDRARREMVTRNLAVRFWDIMEYGNKNEKTDGLYDYMATQLEKIAVEGKNLRRERLVAENLAIGFYASMMGMQVFHPQILPLVSFDFVGWLTDGAWGSSLVSSAFLFTAYGVAVGAKVIAKTKKSYDMLMTLVKVFVDPAESIEGLKQGDAEYQAALDAAKASQKALKDEIRSGKGIFGTHRSRMLANGYSPESPGKFGAFKESCEALLRQVFR